MKVNMFSRRLNPQSIVSSKFVYLQGFHLLHEIMAEHVLSYII